MNRLFLFDSVKIVEGKFNSVILDLQRGSFLKVSILIGRVLNFINIHNPRYKDVNSKFVSMISEAELTLMLKKCLDLEILFESNLKYDFGDKSLINIDTPAIVAKSILEINRSIDELYKQFILDLNALFCYDLQLRFLCDLDLKEVEKFIQFCETTNIKFVEVVYPYKDGNLEINILELLNDYGIIGKLIIYNSPFRKHFSTTDRKYQNRLVYIDKNQNDIKNDYISVTNMIINNDTYHLSKKYNLALYKKVCLNLTGKLQHHLSHKRDFGDYDGIQSIISMIESEQFKYYEGLNSSLIEKCRDCIWRYSCYNSSDFTVNSDSISRSTNCGYDIKDDTWKN